MVVDGLVVEDESNPEKIVDLNGAFIFPAFRDGHCHPLFAGREALGPVVTEDKSVSKIQATLLNFRNKNPNATWIEGGAYDRSIVPEGKFLATWIDEVIDDVPVVLHASDHHTIWVNTKALDLFMREGALPQLESGSIDIGEDGYPTGVLREPDAMKHVLDKAPPRTREQEVKALVWSDNQLTEYGVVEAQDAWIDKGMTAVYLEATEQNLLSLDYNLAFRIEPSIWQDSLSRAVKERAEVMALNNPKLTAKTVKFFADGVFGSGTASVIDPYLDEPDQPHGEPLWSNEELFQACLEASQLGFQLHIHAIGDAGVRQSLDAIEHSQKLLGAPSMPPVIAHAELISPEDIKRFRTLGVIANMQPLWAQEDGMLLSCLPRLGRNRLDQMYRMRDLLNSGAEISFGSDWPVSSANPFLGIATAVSRQTRDSEPKGGWIPSQAMTIVESLKSYSLSVEKQLGRSPVSPLSIGSKADFIVLEENLLEAPIGEMRNLKIKQTYKSGKQIY